MITFGNESLHNSMNNSNKIQVAEKNNQFTLLKKKYQKLEKENKMLKATIEELINLSENLKTSFKNTESMYITISDSIKNPLIGKLYNIGLGFANSSYNITKSEILGLQDNLLNLNQGNRLNFSSSGHISEFNKNGINNNSSLNLNNSVNLPININLKSNTNITNIYNNNKNSSSKSILNRDLNINAVDNSNNFTKISNSEIGNSKENKRRSSCDELKDFSNYLSKSSLKKSSKDNNIVLTLGEVDSNSKISFENYNKDKENFNSINLIIDCKKNEFSHMISENESKSLNNLNVLNNVNNLSNVKDNLINKQFAEKLNNSCLNNKTNKMKSEMFKEQNQNVKSINNNNNNLDIITNDNSTNRDSNKNSNASQNNKLTENKDNKNFGPEINLEIEYENISKLIVENQSKKEENNDELLDKLAENFSELQKKFFKIKFEKEEFEKINIEILKTLRQKEDNYIIMSAKYSELNKYIAILYKSIHSILVLSDSSNKKTQTIKCEPVPSYLKFINNLIN
jgi:hypothetical protein